MSSEDLHVPREILTTDARLLHYAITSLKEELDAVDWYRQRADDIEEEELKGLLLHNMREEMEHASMLLEWIRRRNGDFAAHIKTYLFSKGSILGVEKVAEGKDSGPSGGSGSAPAAGSGDNTGRATIGSLKERR